MYMMKYNWMILFFLVMSPLMVFSLTSWLAIWINMELNLFMFILYIIMNNYNVYDSSMKYFFINVLSSSIFMLMIFMKIYYSVEFFYIVMNFMLMVKLGVVPVHYWFIDLMNNLNWMSCMILSTWQKFIPLYLMFYVYDFNLILIMVILGGFVSIFMGLNCVNLKKLMAYSSINHMGWMMLVLTLSYNMLLLYFYIYLLINYSLMTIFHWFSINYLVDLSKNVCGVTNSLLMFIFFSLGSLPPFFGFYMKWYSIYLYCFSYFMIMLMIFYSLVYLYYYLYFLMLMLMNNFMSIKIFYLNKKKFYIFSMKNILLLLLSIFSLFMIFFFF